MKTPEQLKQYKKEYSRKYYKEHPIYAKTCSLSVGAIAKQRRKIIQVLKEASPCKDCGVRYPHYKMQYDHLRDKTKAIAHLSHSSMERILLEIEKCELVCANCHCERTHKRRYESL